MEREIDAQGHRFGLIATPTPEGWRAKATSHSEGVHAPEVPRPRPSPFGGDGSPLGIIEDGWSESGTTADEALDTLQHRITASIRTAAAEANQAQLDEANRRRRERERRLRPPGQ